ncbi:PEP-CTERM sorting domain-containing protein [Myxacorys almedinensis]|uniref:PEP-CTERM sorting domain-containing protein n=1 Tax=Myxacorys almedinensis A TaxID=2690445 RepID=A0A8J7YXZ6_9CYAN|nr:PEP-CTERM sorting domain-containing protein [Myxacorys almedinensis]NDJ16737.1 PEP-CTERM sorting domain-containing protein [Myxacorys almedinensis A]
MKLNSKICQPWLLAVGSVTACFAIATSPAKAASLAFSGVQTLIEGQISSPTSTEFFKTTIDATSLVLGDGTDFQASARQSIRVEDLFFAADESSPAIFSFDFAALLALDTEIDNPELELAKAKGSLSLALYDLTDGVETLLDSVNINLFGKLNTPGGGDRLRINAGGTNLALLPNLTRTNIGGLEESVVAEVGGSYSRTFYRPTTLKIVQRANTVACVQAPKQGDFCGRAVPEPSSTLALALFLATTGGIVWVRSRKLKPVMLSNTKED